MHRSIVGLFSTIQKLRETTEKLVCVPANKQDLEVRDSTSVVLGGSHMFRPHGSTYGCYLLAVEIYTRAGIYPWKQPCPWRSRVWYGTGTCMHMQPHLRDQPTIWINYRHHTPHLSWRMLAIALGSMRTDFKIKIKKYPDGCGWCRGDLPPL